MAFNIDWVADEQPLVSTAPKHAVFKLNRGSTVHIGHEACRLRFFIERKDQVSAKHRPQQSPEALGREQRMESPDRGALMIFVCVECE